MHLWYSEGEKITGIFPLKANTRGKQSVVCRGTLEQCVMHFREGEYRIKPDDVRLKPTEIEFSPRSPGGEIVGTLPQNKGGKMIMNKDVVIDVLIGLGLLAIVYFMWAK